MTAASAKKVRVAVGPDDQAAAAGPGAQPAQRVLVLRRHRLAVGQPGTGPDKSQSAETRLVSKSYGRSSHRWLAEPSANSAFGA